MKQEYIEISSYDGEGYKPMVDFNTWRVAILRHCEELNVKNLNTMQKHMESDEVFILSDGNCTLFTGGNGDTIKEIDCITMEPMKLYHVKRGVWHTHTLDIRGTVLIIENQNTGDMNSPSLELDSDQKQELLAAYDNLMDKYFW